MSFRRSRNEPKANERLKESPDDFLPVDDHRLQMQEDIIKAQEQLCAGKGITHEDVETILQARFNLY
jgi:hypothetical protein